MPDHTAVRGLYAILDVDVLAARGLDPMDVCDTWMSAGVRLVQVRAKSLSSGDLFRLGRTVVARAHAVGATVIINDRADIAVQCGADGVHVGQDDLTPAEVRRMVGPDAIVGLSTHTEAQVQDAVRQPVSYVAVGPVFATSTKQTGYDPVGLDLVRRAADVVHAHGRPLVAIGGITRALAAEVHAAGADAVAVITALLDDPAW